MKTSPVIVNEIRRLSQEEGLKDSEIANIIQYNSVSVQKIREAYDIPTYKKDMRKDRIEICPVCKCQYYIRRNETPGICCPACAEIINKEQG
jgi:hypothetical protein